MSIFSSIKDKVMTGASNIIANQADRVAASISGRYDQEVAKLQSKYDKVVGGISNTLGKLDSFASGEFAGNLREPESFGGKSVPTYNGRPTDVEYGSPDSFKGITSKIKASYGLPSSTQDSAMLEREYVNRLSIKLVDNIFSHLRCYVFMGKPTCNILDANGNTPESIKRKANLNRIIEDDVDLFKFLNNDIVGTTDFMTPLQNRIQGISIQDANMSKSESASSIRGIRQEYPMSYEESMANVPFTITFSLDRNSEVLRLINVWINYIEELKKGTVQQSPEDQALNRMGYTFPMWIFACEENATDIVFFAKTVGNMPLSIPFSVFSSTGPINTDAKEVTVQFQCSMFKPFDVIGLSEFNRLSENRGPKYFIDSYVPFESRALQYYWVNGAMVSKDSTTGKYRLRFYTTDPKFGGR